MKRENEGVIFRSATRLLYAGALIFMALLTQSSRGQGQINFNNYVPTANPPIDAKVYLYTTDTNAGGAAISGTDTTFRAALLGGPTSATPTCGDRIGTLSLLASPYTAGTWTTFRTGANAGYVAVGTDGARDSGLPYGSMGMFQMVVWQGTETVWTQAYADYKLGLIKATWSNPLILSTTTGPSDSNIPNLIGLQSMAFSIDTPNDCTPEPSSLSLMILGVGAWLLRSKKKT